MQVLQRLAQAGAPLRHLNLQHTDITNAGLDAIARALPHLHTLHLSYCRRVTDDGVARLAAAKKLHTLDVYNAPYVSEWAIRDLAR